MIPFLAPGEKRFSTRDGLVHDVVRYDDNGLWVSRCDATYHRQRAISPVVTGPVTCLLCIAFRCVTRATLREVGFF